MYIRRDLLQEYESKLPFIEEMCSLYDEITHLVTRPSRKRRGVPRIRAVTHNLNVDVATVIDAVLWNTYIRLYTQETQEGRVIVMGGGYSPSGAKLPHTTGKRTIAVQDIQRYGIDIAAYLHLWSHTTSHTMSPSTRVYRFLRRYELLCKKDLMQHLFSTSRTLNDSTLRRKLAINEIHRYNTLFNTHTINEEIEEDNL